MAAPSRRLLANAIAGRLQTSVTNAVGYYGQVGRLLPGADDETTPRDPQPKGPDDPRVKPYYVLYPGAGSDEPDRPLGLCADGLTLPLRLTAVAGDVEDLLALVDRLDVALHLWTPTVAGAVCGPIVRPFGWQSPPVLTDRTVRPERLFLPLDYQLVATT